MGTKRIFPIIAAGFLFGCASGATMKNMVYHGDLKTYDPNLKNSIEVTEVSGGKKTVFMTSKIDDEAFSGALKESLSEQGLLSATGKYQLRVRIIKLDHGPSGALLQLGTIATHVKYTLIDRTNNSVVLDEKIIGKYSASFADSFIGLKRLRLANEGSGKENIEQFLEKLSELKIAPAEIDF